MKPTFTALCLCALAGCASPTVKSEPSLAQTSGPVAVEMRTAEREGDGWHTVAPAASVHSGAEFSLSITGGQNTYIYVGQRTSGGATEIIYPSGDGQGPRLEEGQTTVLPAAEQWFRLDDHVGDENLFILLSTTPQNLATAKRILGEKGEAACAKNRDPPPPTPTIRDRNLKVHGRIGADGLGVLCFPFRHI